MRLVVLVIIIVIIVIVIDVVIDIAATFVVVPPARGVMLRKRWRTPENGVER